MVLNTKSRLAFVFYHKRHLVTFLETGLLEKISNDFELDLYLPSNLNIEKDFYNNFRIVSYLPANRLVIRLTSLLENVSLWKYKDMSMALRVRAINQFASKKCRANWTSVIVYENEELSELKRFLIRILSHNFLYLLLRMLLTVIRNLFYRSLLRSLRIDQKYDLAILPFGGHVSAEFATFTWAFKKTKTKTVALQENWDNVSSKTVLTYKPDFFLAWGEQSAAHLRMVHNFDPQRIHIVGAPKFDGYFKKNTKKAIANSQILDREIDLYNSEYILITGTGDGIDDFELISSCYKAIDNGVGTKVSIVYRPHPSTRSYHDLCSLVENYPNLILDEGESARKYDHHIGLVRNAKLVINHFSTISLEALISNVPVCLPLHLGRNSKFNYSRAVDEYSHYIGIRLLSLVSTPGNVEEFEQLIKNFVNDKNQNKEISNAAYNLSWICKKGPYYQNFKYVIDNILDNASVAQW